MKSTLELPDSRIDDMDIVDGIARIHFSHASIRKTRGVRDAGTAWSQEALLVMEDAATEEPLPQLPGSIAEGHLEVGGIRHELIPLPFRRKVAATLRLTFIDGAQMTLTGMRPHIELLGTPIYLDDYP